MKHVFIIYSQIISFAHIVYLDIIESSISISTLNKEVMSEILILVWYWRT